MPGSDSPVFVLCTARSGSTVLRLMLDAHPELACPPETNLVNAFSDIGFTAAVTLGGAKSGTTVTYETCRLAAEQLMGPYMRATGKRRWADKSLASIDMPELLLNVYPNARFVCLYRDCRDTVASLQEVCQWGYGGFGIEPYVRQYQANLVLALATYWLDKVSKAAAFEQANPDHCIRLRYEDLVAQPADSLAAVFKFIGVTYDATAVGQALRYTANGKVALPGDIKVRFTDRPHTGSIGRGWSVPVEMLPDATIERINDVSVQLGYLPITALVAAAEASSGGSITRAAPASPELVAFLATFSSRAGEKLAGMTRRRNGDGASIKLVLADGAAGPWVIDTRTAKITEADAAADWIALTDSQTLYDLAFSRCNPGSALRGSLLQLATADGEDADGFFEQAELLVELIKV